MASQYGEKSLALAIASQNLALEREARDEPDYSSTFYVSDRSDINPQEPGQEPDQDQDQDQDQDAEQEQTQGPTPVSEPELQPESQPEAEAEEADHSNILDRHNRAVAQILSHFRNIVMAATTPLSQNGNVIEHAALNRMTMETESAALISEIQGLLAINREIKALWIRGPLRQPGEDDAREAEIDRQAEKVARLYDQVLEMRDGAIRAENAARAQGGASNGGSGSGGVKGGEGASATAAGGS